MRSSRPSRQRLSCTTFIAMIVSAAMAADARDAAAQTAQPAGPPTAFGAEGTRLNAEGTSTAGTLLMPPPAPAPPPQAAFAPLPVAATQGTQDETLEQRVRTLEARLDAAERANEETSQKISWLKRFSVSGFVQGQLLWQWFNAAASPNLINGALPAGVGANDAIAKADPTTGIGITTNGDYFRLRRARLKTEFMPTDYARLVFEIDPTPAGGTNNGNGTIARQVEAQGITHWTDDATTTFAAGIFKVPFGFEILQSDADRPFIERSWGERNMFPGEYDTGARAYTTLFEEKLTVQAAVLNGITEGEKAFAILPDLEKGKDLVGRVNYDFGPVDVGVSGYYGQGQIVDPVGLRFKQFPRKAVDLEAALHHTFSKRIGQTRVFAEAIFAQNMDRGVNYVLGVGLPAFPANVVADKVQSLNERSTWLRVEQDLSRWLTLALRYDFYSPDTSQKNNGRDTYSVVGVIHFTKGLQYMLEFDGSIDNVHVLNAPPPSKHIEALSNVLQVRF